MPSFSADEEALLDMDFSYILPVKYLRKKRHLELHMPKSCNEAAQVQNRNTEEENIYSYSRVNWKKSGSRTELYLAFRERWWRSTTHLRVTWSYTHECLTAVGALVFVLRRGQKIRQSSELIDRSCNYFLCTRTHKSLQYLIFVKFGAQCSGVN